MLQTVLLEKLALHGQAPTDGKADGILDLALKDFGQ